MRGHQRYSQAITALMNGGHIFDDQVVAQAIIDRLIHHAHIFPINGESYRIKDKLRRGGGCNRT